MAFPVQVTGKIKLTDGSPLAGVCVSNGQMIVRSDDAGNFSLPVMEKLHRFVFITTPDGYASEGDFFVRTAGWQGNRHEVEFLLRPSPERAASAFTIAQVTDTHLTLGQPGSSTPQWVAQQLQRVVTDADPAFIIASGDMTTRGTDEQLREYCSVVNSLDRPVFTLFGGHDGNEERFDDNYQLSYTSRFERDVGPVYYSFNWGGYHFVLYSNEPHFYNEDDTLHKRQWIAADLALQPPGRPTIFVVHTHDTSEVDLVRRGRHTPLLLYGHWHSGKVTHENDMAYVATMPICFGAIDTRPRGYRKIEINGSDIGYELKPLSNGSPVRRSLDVGPFEIAWQRQFEMPLHRSSPVCVDGRIIQGASDESHRGQQGVTCLDPDTGQTLWHTPTDSSIKNTVVVRNGLCIAASVAGGIYAIETATGQVNWCAQLPDYPRRWIHTTPALGDDHVYCGAQSGIAAIRLADGQFTWYQSLGEFDAWPCYASASIYGSNLLQLITRRGIVAFDLATGAVNWEHQYASEYQQATPVLAGDQLVCVGDKGHLLVLEASTGKALWHEPVLGSQYASALAVQDKKIFAVTVDGHVQCHELDGGRLLWKYELGPDLLDMTPYRYASRSALAQPVFFNGQCFVAGIDGCLHVLDSAGQAMDIARFGSPLSATPCVSGNAMFLSAYDGTLYKLIVNG